MSDRITQIEQDLLRLNERGRIVAKAGLVVSTLGAALERKVALNTASLESFERSFATMQAQLDKLTQEKSDE